MNDIYIRARLIGSRTDAINQVTAQWSNMQEKIDFEQWLKFYEKGGANLYKNAENGIPMLPFQAIPGLTPKSEHAQFINTDIPKEDLKSKNKKDDHLGRLSFKK